jgi:hypothetical protein
MRLTQGVELLSRCTRTTKSTRHQANSRGTELVYAVSVRAGGAAKMFLGMCACVALLPHAAKSQTQLEARELWQQMLAAKGVTVSPIRSFVLSSKALSGSARYNGGAGRERRTIVASLPNGWWTFNDFRPGKLGASVEAFDLSAHSAWIAFPALGKPAEPANPDTPSALEDRERILAIFFCQAPGFEPTPLEASRVHRGFHTYDVVKARWKDELIYYLDPSTHLPSMLEIVVKGTTTVPAYRDRPAKTISYTDVTPIVMRDYHEVSGIQVPARVKLWDSWDEDQIELNLNISPDLFRNSPAGVVSADDWKKQQIIRQASP